MQPKQSDPNAHSPAHSRRRYRVMGIAACCAVFGLLIWAKLQLVASVPRTVLADPERPAEPTDEAPQAHDTESQRP